MPYVRFSGEFKIQIVKQALEEGASVIGLAASYEVAPASIYRWIRAWNERVPLAFPGTGHPFDDQELVIKNLRKRLNQLEQEREILKKYHTFLKSSPKTVLPSSRRMKNTTRFVSSVGRSKPIALVITVTSRPDKGSGTKRPID